jgi:hypothetical protein
MDGNAGAGEIQVALDINGVWNAIATESWIIIDEKHDVGTGSGKVLFKYTDNNTGKERTGKIIIAGEEYTITQAARQNITIATAVSNHGGHVDGGGIYNIGTEIELAAIADEGYEFVSWSLSGGGQSSESVLKVVAMENGTYTANFKPLIPTLQIDSANLRGVLLRWKHLPWAVDYNIWRGITSATNAATRIASLSNDGQCQYLDVTGVENQKYWYWIEAIGAEDDVLWDTCKYIRRMEERLGSLRHDSTFECWIYEHGTHFAFPESMLKMMLPVGSGLLVSFMFRAGKEHNKECRKTRIDIDRRLKKALAEW